MDPADLVAILRSGRLRALRDLVILEVAHPKEVQLDSGLILPPASRADEGNFPTGIEGRVVAVGPGRVVGKRFVETLARKGQRVIFPRYAGETIRLPFDGGGECDFFWCHDDEVLCEVIGEGEIKGLVSAPTLVSSGKTVAA